MALKTFFESSLPLPLFLTVHVFLRVGDTGTKMGLKQAKKSGDVLVHIFISPKKLLSERYSSVVRGSYIHGFPGWNGLTGWFGLLDAPRETRASFSTGEDQTVEAGSRAAAMIDETRMV